MQHPIHIFMRKITLLLAAIFISISAYAQLEVKPGSFREVVGFVNIDPDKQTDDNEQPYAVLKVKTENINDRQRRELKFQGDARTFFELEYRDGEVWLYISYYATFLKISHPDLSSTEFYLPFDMKPKKGYEMTLVNNAKSDIDEQKVLSLIEQWQQANTGNNTVDTVVIQQQQVLTPAKKEGYTFVTVNAAINKYGDLSFGLTLGKVNKFGWFASVMSSFDFKGLNTVFECDADGYVNGYYPVYTGKESVTNLSAIVGVMMRVYKPLSVRLGAGYGMRTISHETLDNKWVKDTSLSVNGVDVQLGLQCNFGGFVLSLDGVATNFKQFEAKIGLGYGF